MTKEQTMQTNAARGAALRATMQAFETSTTQLITSAPQCLADEPPEPPSVLLANTRPFVHTPELLAASAREAPAIVEPPKFLTAAAGSR
jgi:hypothetical protein